MAKKVWKFRGNPIRPEKSEMAVTNKNCVNSKYLDGPERAHVSEGQIPWKVRFQRASSRVSSFRQQIHFFHRPSLQDMLQYPTPLLRLQNSLYGRISRRALKPGKGKWNGISLTATWIAEVTTDRMPLTLIHICR